MARTGGRLAWLIAITAAAVPATAVAQLPTGYTIQSFGDEFDGTSLDTATWNAGVINYPSGSTWLWRNHPGNNAVSGGYLVQTTLYQDVTGDGVPEWTCSSVSARSFSQRFGYWESRIRITDFDYTDNAWWSSDIGTGHLSGMDGFEIDGPEAWSPNKYTASIYDHAVQDGSTPTSIHFAQNLTGKNFTTSFSVFGWDWGIDNTVKCYVDGTLVHTFPAAAMNGIEALVPQGPVQGTALWTTGLTPSNTIANGDTKYVDYVRVYQKPGWTGTGGLKSWGDHANWGPDGVPASGRAAVFNTAAASGTITITADQPVQEIVFQGGATGTTTIAGTGRLLLGMTTAVTATTGAIGGINLVNDTTASVTVAADMVAQRKVQFSNFAGASITTGPTPGVELVLAGDLAAATAGTPVNFLTTAPIVVTGSIDGSIGRITKGGQGIVQLNAANAFAGGLEIRDGIIEVNADGALGAVAGGVTMEPGSAYDKPSLVLNGVSYSDPVPIAIRGSGSRSTGFPQSSGAIDATGTSRFAGPITAVDDATISVQRGGQLTLSGTLDTRDHVLTLGSIGSLTVSGRITGSSAGQIDKYNTGSTSLTGDNSGFLGSVKVRLGTLVVNGDAALGGGSGDVVRLDGGALQVTADFTSGKGGSFAATAGNAIHTNGRSIAFNGSFSGPGGLIKQGAGMLTFGGSNSFQGATRIQSGTLAVAHAAALAGATLDLATGDSGALRLAVAGTTTYLFGGLEGGRDLPLGGNTLSIGHNGTNTSYSGRITGTGGLVKAGSGMLALSASNSFTGTTRIVDGTLSIEHVAALAGATLELATGDVGTIGFDAGAAATYSLGGLQGTRDLAAGGASLSIGANAASTAYAGVLSGSGGLLKVGGGTLTLTGTSTFTGGTTIREGVVAIAGDSRLGAAAGGLTLDGGTLQSTASMTLAAARRVTVGPGGGTLQNSAAGNLFVSGSVVGAGATLTVRTSSSVIGAAFLDGPVSLGRLALSGSTSGVGLRSSAVVGSAVVAAAGQTLHLNGLNSTGTAASSYAGFDVTLDGGTLRNRFGGNTFSRGITLTTSSTLENRSGNGNSLTLAAGSLALGTNVLTVRTGTAATEWVAIAGGVSGSAASGLTLTGGGQLRLAGSNPGFAGRITIAHGEVRLDSATAVNAGVAVGFSGTAAVKMLSLNAASVELATLDLPGDARVEIGAGTMTVGSGLSASRLRDALVQGRGQGSWASPVGITSSAVAASIAAGDPRAIGWMAADDGSVSFAAAAPGDTNIDRIVDVLDAANLLGGNGFDSGQQATWTQGDFDYDGIVDVLDVAGFLSSGLFDAGPYEVAVPVAAAPVVVPEPMISWPLCLLVGGGWCALRVRRCCRISTAFLRVRPLRWPLHRR